MLCELSLVPRLAQYSHKCNNFISRYHSFYSLTDCSLSELQVAEPPSEDNYPQCQQDQDIVTFITIPNGVVNVTCYCGRQFVSVASHVCDEGYQPNATSSVRVCRDNGVWSGTNVVCGE